MVCVMHFSHALRVHRNHIPINVCKGLFTIHCRSAGLELRGVNHVSGTTGVYQQCRCRQRLHQTSHPASVIQMHMGGDNKFHLFMFDIPLRQQGKNNRHGIVRAGLDDGVFILSLEQIAGRQPFTHHGGVDSGNVVADIGVGLG